MATSEHGRHASGLLLISTLLILALEFHPASAQQTYNNVTGYQCNGAAQTCQAFAYYRTHGTNSTLNSTASLFNTTAAAIADTNAPLFNNTSITAPLAGGISLYIPLACGCVNGTYQAPITKVVVAGDTMYLIANNTLQGLVTFQAIVAANPSIVPTNMRIGDKLRVPLRCACPTTLQVASGTRSLLTYAVYPNDDIPSISKQFNVSEAEVLVANSRGTNTTVVAFTTVLVPLKTKGSAGVNVTGPAPAPSSASRGFEAHLLGLVALLAVQSLFF